MKALLVCAAPAVDYESLVAEEASLADIVIAVDGGAALCARAGVQPDVVVGDLDSLPVGTREELHRRAVPVVQFPADKDETDLDLALGVAHDRAVDEVIVCAAFSGRLDHTLAACGSLARASALRPVLVEPGQRGWIVDALHRPVLELGGVGDTFSVVALSLDAVCSVDGARWPLSHSTLDVLGTLGVSNCVTGSQAKVEVHRGTALVLLADLRHFA